MRCLRLSVAWVVLVLSVAHVSACGGGAPPPPAALSSRWTGPAILRHVPADTPYLFATLEPIDDALRRKLRRGINARVASALDEIDKLRGDDGSRRDPWAQTLLAIADVLRGLDLERLDDALGLDPRGQFALYGLSVWPVMRVELTNPGALHAMAARLMTAAGVALQRRSLDGHAYWVAGNAELSFVAAVLEREAIAAVVPTRALDEVLPLVLGTRPAGPSLADAATVPALLARHRYVGAFLGYVDSHQLVEIAVRDRPRPIEALLRGAIGPVPGACRGDLARIADLVPRVVMGYRALDQSGFDASLVIELADRALQALRRMHTAVPDVEARPAGHPLFALGAALDSTALIAGLREATRELAARPFSCPWLRGLDETGATLARALDQPFSPMWRGIRGGSLVIENLSLEPTNVAGHALLASDRIVDLVPVIAAASPALASLALRDDGKPIALPVGRLDLPARSAHAALTSGRLVVAAGDDSARRATAHLAAAAPARSPLMVMTFNIPRARQLLAASGQPTDSLANLSHVADVGMAFDTASDGLHVDVWGTWASDAPPGR